MAASSAVIGYGATFTWDSSAIEEVTQFSTPSFKLDAVEATFMASDNTYREYIPGLCEGGEITLSCNYRPKATGQAKITSDLHGRTSASLVIVLPNSLGTWTQTCFVTGWNSTVTTDGRMVGTATFKVTGKPVLS